MLLNHDHESYQQVLRATKQGMTFFQAENDHFGFAHTLIGALVAKKWNFTPLTCQVILQHHNLVGPPIQTVQQEMIAIVQLADCIGHHLGYGHSEGYSDLTEEMQGRFDVLGISKNQRDFFIQQINTEFLDTPHGR